MSKGDIDIIAEYVSQDIRNKIVFCQEHIDGLTFINIGQTLAMSLRENPTKVSYAFSLLKKIIGNPSKNEKIGKYIAIENIDILFEPDLHLDVNFIIGSLSMNQCLIIKSNMEIITGKLCYPKFQNEQFINLKDFNYLMIKNSI